MNLRSTKPSLGRKLATGFCLLALSLPAWAELADLSESPLATQSTAAIRPNLMFILDDSGSMGDGFLPDEAEFGNSGNTKYGRFASQCNGVAYNPSATYVLPVDATAQPLAAGSYTFPTPNDGLTNIQTVNSPASLPIATGSITLTLAANTNLNYTVGEMVTIFAGNDNANVMVGVVTDWRGNTRALTVNVAATYGSGSLAGAKVGKGSLLPFYYTYSGTTQPLSYTYTSAGVDTGSTFYKECNTVVGSTPGRNVFSLVVLTPATITQHYRDWYTYYRTRILAMKSAVSRVFSRIDATRFRVGFSTIHDQGSVDGDEFLNIRNFDEGTQKSDFFAKLFATQAGGSTPLRSALAKAGRYYAKGLTGQTVDPVQYSCQRNYTILSSDGYWNKGDEWDNSVVTLSGGSIGNQDGTPTERPYLDDWRSNNRTGGAGVSNTLADIAMYYYKTDLRTSGLNNCAGAVDNQDVCENNVDKVTGDDARHQHMNTITLGLGLAGTLTYDPAYATPQGDFFDIVNGNRPWPNPDPNPTANPDRGGPERVDDMWHAAVNGRGYFYSARSSDELVTTLTDALDAITAEDGSGAAAATSNLTPLEGDNFVYLASYRTVVWNGDVKAMTMNPSTGVITSTTPAWSAATRLLGQVDATSDTRTIYFRHGTNLRSFTYANLSAAGLNGSFDDLCPTSGTPKLSQCTTITDSAVKAQITGTNLVNWLRGRGQHENVAANTTRLFRDRTDNNVRNVLGDIVHSAPIYIKRPTLRYADSGYSAYATAQVNRQGVVFVGSNDGMLHALNADTGDELWAFVPTAVMSKMHKLADYNYASNHLFLVDGTLTGGDVFDPSGNGSWRTIIVGGLNSGGRSFFALDVTVPTSPTVLWEFSDDDLGYSFGNPVITKLKDGTWAVAFSSGYNNVNPGNGNGYLYVVNAITGAQISKIPTQTTGNIAAGSTETPSNLGRINAWVESEFDNTALRMYGGDMLGNIWRFDHDDNLSPSGREGMLLAQALADGGVPQPITTRPEIGEIRDNGIRYALVAVGTGRYLGLSDVGSTGTQSVYVFKDTLGTTGLGSLRDNAGMIEQTLANATVNSVAGIVVSNHTDVDWSTATGWYVDLQLNAGERVNVDMQLQLDALTVATNDPGNSACVAGGTSYLYTFDFKSGNSVEGDGMLVGTAMGNTLIVGQTVVGLGAGSSGSGVTSTCVLVVNSDGTVSCVPRQQASGALNLRRSSWRELAN